MSSGKVNRDTLYTLLQPFRKVDLIKLIVWLSEESEENMQFILHSIGAAENLSEAIFQALEKEIRREISRIQLVDSNPLSSEFDEEEMIFEDYLYLFLGLFQEYAKKLEDIGDYVSLADLCFLCLEEFDNLFFTREQTETFQEALSLSLTENIRNLEETKRKEVLDRVSVLDKRRNGIQS